MNYSAINKKHVFTELNQNHLFSINPLSVSQNYRKSGKFASVEKNKQANKQQTITTTTEKLFKYSVNHVRMGFPISGTLIPYMKPNYTFI